MFGVLTFHSHEGWLKALVDWVKRFVPISDNYIWMMWTFHNDLFDTWYDSIHWGGKVETNNGSRSIILISHITQERELYRGDSGLLPGDRQVNVFIMISHTSVSLWHSCDAGPAPGHSDGHTWPGGWEEPGPGGGALVTGHHRPRPITGHKRHIHHM